MFSKDSSDPFYTNGKEWFFRNIYQPESLIWKLLLNHTASIVYYN